MKAGVYSANLFNPCNVCSSSLGSLLVDARQQRESGPLGRGGAAMTLRLLVITLLNAAALASTTEQSEYCA